MTAVAEPPLVAQPETVEQRSPDHATFPVPPQLEHWALGSAPISPVPLHSGQSPGAASEGYFALDVGFA
jgi:hypothetical protein